MHTRARPAIPATTRPPIRERLRALLGRILEFLATSPLGAAVVGFVVCGGVLLIPACHMTAAQAAALEDAATDACTRLLPLADLPAGVDALACEGAEDALRLALTEAAKASPVAAPTTAARAPVYKRGRLVGVVPAHLVAPVSAALK